LADAAGAFYFIAAVNIVVGLGTAIFRLEFLRGVSGGWFSVIFGLIFAGIGYGVADGSRAALGVGLLIFLVDTGLLVGATVTEGYQLGFAGMLLRAYLLFTMMRGFFAELNSAGMLPVSLLRWQLTGRDDEIRQLWQPAN
jgi:hypothetical protein